MVDAKLLTKLDEVADIIYQNTDQNVWSEFEAVRLVRMTKDAENLDFIRAKKQRMIIYYQANQYERAKEELRTLIPYVSSGNYELYVSLMAISIRIGSFSDALNLTSRLNFKIISSAQDQQLQKRLLWDIGSLYVFSGNLKEGGTHFMKILNELKMSKTNVEYLDLDGVIQQWKLYLSTYDSLSLEDTKVRELSKILEEFISLNHVRVLGAIVSFPNDEFLVDLMIDKSINDVVSLNDQLFNLVYDKNLINEFDAFSINFSPISVDQLKDAIY